MPQIKALVKGTLADALRAAERFGIPALELRGRRRRADERNYTDVIVPAAYEAAVYEWFADVGPQGTPYPAGTCLWFRPVEGLKS